MRFSEAAPKGKPYTRHDLSPAEVGQLKAVAAQAGLSLRELVSRQMRRALPPKREAVYAMLASASESLETPEPTP